MGWVIFVLVLFILQIAAILVAEFRNPSKSVAWLMVLFILPFIGFVVYYFMAKEYRQRKLIGRKDLRRQRTNEIVSNAPSLLVPDENHPDACKVFKETRLMGLLRNIPESPIRSGNYVTVYNDAASTYAALFQAIDQAEQFVYLESYIVRDDNVGKLLQQALIRKAREGVTVRLIVDGLGSYQLSKSYYQELRDGGVQVFSFLPPLLAFFDKRLNYRNHRKIAVIDGQVGYVGGINIGDEYLGEDPKLGYWRDTHLEVRGPCVYDLQRTFAVDWAFVSGTPLMEVEPYTPQDVISAGAASEHMQIIASGPDATWDAVQEVFFTVMAAAKNRIYITTPYFIPDPGIAIALKTAALSGLDVRIILPYVSDSKIVHWASLSYLKDFLLAGVRCYQYRKGFVHAKTVIIDDMVGTVGTANMDMRSFFSNFEIMAVLYEYDSIERLEMDFEQDLLDSIEIDPQQFLNRSRFIRGREVIARVLSPLF